MMMQASSSWTVNQGIDQVSFGGFNGESVQSLNRAANVYSKRYTPIARAAMQEFGALPCSFVLRQVSWLAPADDIRLPLR